MRFLVCQLNRFFTTVVTVDHDYELAREFLCVLPAMKNLNLAFAISEVTAFLLKDALGIFRQEVHDTPVLTGAH